MLEVAPQYTSQRCSYCQYVDAQNRQTQEKFVYLACFQEQNADINAARNILAAGHAALAWQKLSDEWRQSGLSQPEFCKRNDINYNQFVVWRSKFLRAAGLSRHQFKPVKVQPPLALSTQAVQIHLPCKFKDYLPLYRQERLFQRIGVDLPRASLSNWVIRCGDLLLPLYKLLQDRIRCYNITSSDKTPVQVLHEPGREAEQKSFMWVFSDGPPEQQVFLYHYSPSCSHEIIEQFFEGFSGYLHCDGYIGYEAKPLLNKFKRWCDEKIQQVFPQSTLGKAIQYTLNQWPKLINYLQDGRLEFSNNHMERAVKPFVIGRKNFLFANNVAGANAAAIIYSIIETCKAHKIPTYEYLSYVFEELPSATTLEQLENLHPFKVDPALLLLVDKGGD